jgi:hypothetical protein
MKIKYGKRDFTIESSKFDETITVLHLRKKLLDILLREESVDHEEEEVVLTDFTSAVATVSYDENSSASSHQNTWEIKLILHGRVLHDTEKILSLPGGIHAKIVMVATKEMPESDLQSRPRVRDDLSQGSSKKADRSSNKLRKTASSMVKYSINIALTILANMICGCIRAVAMDSSLWRCWLTCRGPTKPELSYRTWLAILASIIQQQAG